MAVGTVGRCPVGFRIVYMDQQKTKVALYIRVSTQQQDTELQRTELTAYAEAKGWKVSRIYEEKLSGTSANRPELKKMMIDAGTGKFSVILVWKLDRFARSLKDLLNLLDTLSKIKVAFISMKDRLDLTSPSGILMTQLLGAFSEFEAALIRERVRAGLENARRNGKILGRKKTRDDVAILSLRAKGFTVRKIAKELHTSTGSVQRAISACAKNPSKK